MQLDGQGVRGNMDRRSTMLPNIFGRRGLMSGGNSGDNLGLNDFDNTREDKDLNRKSYD